MNNSAPNPKPVTASAPAPVAEVAPAAGAHELPAAPAPERVSLYRIVFLYIIPGLLVLATAAFFIIGSPYVKTENAYTKAEIAAVSAQVSAPVTEIFVKENHIVREGDLLFRLDDEPFRIKSMEVEASLEDHRREVEALKSAYREKLIALDVAKSDAAFAEREFKRQSELASTRVVSEARFDRAQHDMNVARQKVTIVSQDLVGLLVALAGNPDLPVEQHPGVIEAQAKVTRAALDLARTEVRAPLDGYVSNVPNRGDFIRAGFPALSIVATSDIWIEANFKETQLTFVEPGQPVKIKVDAFPGWEWDGYVESIASATGSEFSILPAQNSTGNWVIVVLRIPVRIRIEPRGDEPVLGVGFSAHVSIDIGIRRGTFAPRRPARTIAPDDTLQD